MVGQPYDQLGAGLQSAASSFAADSAARGAAAENYFRQAGAAVPLARQALEHEIAAANAEKAGSGDLSDSELRVRLMGAGELMREADLADARKQHHIHQRTVEQSKDELAGIRSVMMDVKRQLKRWKQGKPTTIPPAQLVRAKNDLENRRALYEDQLARARMERAPYTEKMRRPASVEEYARLAGTEAGHDPTRVLGLVQPKAPKPASLFVPINEAARQVGINDRTMRRIKRSEDWALVSEAAEAAIRDGEPWETFMANVDAYLPKHKRRLRRLAAAVFAPAFGR